MIINKIECDLCGAQCPSYESASRYCVKFFQCGGELYIHSRDLCLVCMKKLANWATRKVIISEAKENEHEFYCAVNVDKVPKDATGKQWEFSCDGVNWSLGFFLGVDFDSSERVFVYESYPYDQWVAFMRPIPIDVA